MFAVRGNVQSAKYTAHIYGSGQPYCYVAYILVLAFLYQEVQAAGAQRPGGGHAQHALP